MTTYFNIKEPLNAPSTSNASDVFGYLFSEIYGPPNSGKVTDDVPQFPNGANVEVRALFYDQNLNLVDPSLVALQVRNPVPETFTYQYGISGNVVKESTGIYHAFLDTSQLVFTWTWRWNARGVITASMPDQQFYILASNLS